jgi:hypothetical protein
MTNAGVAKSGSPAPRSMIGAPAARSAFARADTATVRRHLSALNAKELKAALAAYRLLGLRSLELAKAAGAKTSALKEIEKLKPCRCRDPISNSWDHQQKNQ